MPPIQHSSPLPTLTTSYWPEGADREGLDLMTDVGPVVYLSPSATALYSNTFLSHLVFLYLILPSPFLSLNKVTGISDSQGFNGCGAAEGKGSLFGAILVFLFSLPPQQECGLCSTAWSPKGDLTDSADLWLGPQRYTEQTVLSTLAIGQYSGNQDKNTAYVKSSKL